MLWGLTNIYGTDTDPSSSGKSVLASMMVTELKNLQESLSSEIPPTKVSVVFFYCKQGGDKDNLLGIVRGLLSQIVKQSPELYPVLYEIISGTGEPGLTSEHDARGLLTKALSATSATVTYIIIDGLDECEADQVKSVIAMLTKIMESLNLPPQAEGSCRIFFTSRDENHIRRQLTKAHKVKIRPKDNEEDMRSYAYIQAAQIQCKFELSDIEGQNLVDSVTSRANGKFGNFQNRFESPN